MKGHRGKAPIGNRMFHIPSASFYKIFLIASLAALHAQSATAAPEEIQVYLDEFAETGKFGLDLHTIYTVSTKDSLRQPPLRQLRLTPELSYGLNDHFEVAGYFLTNRAFGGSPQTDGVKLRVRYRPIVPTEETTWYTAVNVELGKVSRRFNSEGSNGEIKGILAFKSPNWVAGLNLNIDRPLKRVSASPTTFEIDGKLAYKVSQNLQFGVEHYAFRGALHGNIAGFMPSRTTFLVSDFAIGKWDINFGIGRAFGDVPDKVIIKAIIGVPI